MTGDLLYRWPAASAFGGNVPKAKFYEHGKVSAATRQRFVAELQRITWAYKLADSTVNLRGNSEVPEIQVFVLEAKHEDVGDGVLAAIDHAVRFPIIFEINRTVDGKPSVRMAAAYKHLSQSRVSVSDYFSTSWCDAEAPRTPLPAAIDLPVLYDALLIPMLPFAARVGEPVAGAVERVGAVRKLQREVDHLEQRLRNEPQFNRKVELRRAIRNMLAELEQLNAAEPSTTQEATWTS